MILMMNETISQADREKLYQEVWSEPIITIAPRYNLSDNGLRKKCKKYWIPLPTVGHWAKVRAGQKVPIPKLPEVRGDLRKLVTNYVLKLRPNLDAYSDEVLRDSPGFFAFTDETNVYIQTVCSNLRIKETIKTYHSLINEHKAEMAYRQKRDQALKAAKGHSEYYQLVKEKYREDRAVLPINVSEVNVDRAYRFFDTLINCIEGLEGEFVIRSDIESYIRLLKDAIHFSLKEGQTVKSGSQTKLPHLELRMREYEWYSSKEKKEFLFADNETDTLESQIGNIVYKIMDLANRSLIDDILQERQRQRDIEFRKRQMQIEQRRKTELEEINKLEQISDEWLRAENIRNFANALEARLNNGQFAESHQRVESLIKWAREKADWLDPFVIYEDELLGKKQILAELVNKQMND